MQVTESSESKTVDGAGGATVVNNWVNAMTEVHIGAIQSVLAP